MPIGRILNRSIDALFAHFASNRLPELLMAIGFFGEGVLLVFSPSSIENGAFRFLLQIMSVQTVTIFYFMIGVSRIIALVLNGHWMPWGAYTRAVGAAFGAVMLAQMDAALVTYSTHGNTLPFGTPFFGVFALVETVSMYRALLGAKAYGTGLGLGDSNRVFMAAGAGAIFDRRHNGGAGDHSTRTEGVEVIRGGRSLPDTRTGRS
jgi:hypothetical protein